ncbi:MAG: glycosyltransferase family 39 protein [Minicystis sp.]
MDREARKHGETGAPPRGRIAAALIAHHRFILGVLLLVAFVAVRLVHIEADPPMRLPNNARVYELFTDPPAKSYEARNWALFGQWATSPVDNYQFWRLQAPVWVYSIAGFYRLFGVGYLQLRVFSTLCAATGLVAMLALGARRLRGWPFFIAGAFLTFNFYYIVYARSGLLEALLNTFVILTILCLHRAQRRLVWLMGAQWALLLAFLTKQTGIYLLPLALVAGVIAYRKQVRAGVPRWLRIAPLAQGAVIVAFLGFYVLRPAYLRTVTWNYGHMLFDKGAIDHVEIGKLPLGAALDRLRAGATWDTGFFSLFPVAGLLALLEILRVIRRAFARRFDAWELLVAGWLASGLGVLLLTPFLWVHYRLILFPPVMLLSASLLHATFRDRWMQRNTWLIHIVSIGALSLELVVQARWIDSLFRNPVHAMREGTRLIRAHAGNEGAAFAGMWSGPLVFDTKHKYYYIKDIFNTRGEVIGKLGITHIFDMERTDMVNGLLWQTHPGAMSARQHLVQFDLRGHTVHVFKFDTPPSDETLNP